MRILMLALVFFSVIGLTGIAVRPVGADASGPNISVGDYWSYNYWILSGPFNLTGTVKQTVTAAVTVGSGGSSIDAFNISQFGSGYVTGSLGTGSWNLEGFTLYQKSDLGTMSGSGIITLAVNQVSATIRLSSVSTPAQGGLMFPLSVGKSWTQTVTTKTNTTSTVIVYPFPPTTKTVSTTNITMTTYAVIDNPLVTVPAGTFDSYEVQSSDVQSTHQIYYSPQTNEMVKEVDSNSTSGQVTGRWALKDYSSWPYSASYDLGSGQHALIRTDVPSSSFNHNSSTLSFQVTGRDGTSGRASITLPRLLNTTDLIVLIDGHATTSTMTTSADSITISIQLSYSSHTISARYAASPGTPVTPSTPATPASKAAPAPSLPLNYIIGGLLVAVVVVALASVLLLRGRGGKEPAPVVWGPSETPPAPPPSVPAPAPSSS